jgi:hypothetical protein
LKRNKNIPLKNKKEGTKLKMKKCFKCGIEKDLNDFYKHPAMADGHLNKCRECTKKDSVNNYHHKKQCDSGFMERERTRTRQRYYRLDYRNRIKPNFEQKKESIERYKKKFPEKYDAMIKSQHVVAPTGKVKHHWSYKPEHYKDVLFLEVREHSMLHRFIEYDRNEKMFRIKNTGELLDSKEKHLLYLKSLLTEQLAA